jgi:hypothetical protein
MSISLSGSLLITGSLTATSTLTAQTLVVQTVTSSIVYSSGSNIFGNSQSNVQQMTGSVNITGSFTQTGANTISSFSGSVGIGGTPLEKLTVTGPAGSQGFIRWSDFNTSAFLGITGSTAFVYANNNSLAFGASGSNIFSPTMTITGSKVGIGTTNPSSSLGIDNSVNANTTAITITGYSSVPKAHIGQFSNNLYLSSNWYYAGGQQKDTGSYGSTAIVLGTGTVDTDNYIDFSTATSSLSSPTNRMRVTSAGSVGIGTTTTSGKLTLYQNTAGNVLQSIVSNQGGATQVGISFCPSMADSEAAANSAQGAIYATDYNYSTRIYFANKTPGAIGNSLATRMLIFEGGNISIGGSYTTSYSDTVLSVTGTTTDNSAYAFIAKNSTPADLFIVRNDGVIFTGTSTRSPYNDTNAAAANLIVVSGGNLQRSTASSRRFKENINDWNGNGLDTILALKPKTFNYKESYYKYPEIEMLGLIAEDVAEVSPYLADYENQDRTGLVENVRYANIVVPLVKAIQELSAKVDAQAARIEELENK